MRRLIDCITRANDSLFKMIEGSHYTLLGKIEHLERKIEILEQKIKQMERKNDR